jgi:hypothetical protein
LVIRIELVAVPNFEAAPRFFGKFEKFCSNKLSSSTKCEEILD